VDPSDEEQPAGAPDVGEAAPPPTLGPDAAAALRPPSEPAAEAAPPPALPAEPAEPALDAEAAARPTSAPPPPGPFRIDEAREPYEPNEPNELRAPTIFVTDPTVEAARIEWDLRARGYDVIDVPLAMLVGRVAVQRPQLILLDIDAAGALDAAARVRQLPDAAGIRMVYAGGTELAADDDRVVARFSRPIDVDALIRKIEQLAPIGVSERLEVDSSQPSSSRPPPPSLRAPPSVGSAHTQAASLPMIAPSSRPPPDRRGLRASEPPVSLRDEPVASSERRAASVRTPEQRLSPDLEKLLREAEQRVLGAPISRVPDGGQQVDEEILSPEDEVEAVLPAEILASLDEPLDLDIDDEEGGSSETGGGTPHTRGTRARHTTGHGREGPAAAHDEAPATNPGHARERDRTGARHATTSSGTTSSGRELSPAQPPAIASPTPTPPPALGAAQAPTPPPPRRAAAPIEPEEDPSVHSEVFVPRQAPEPSQDHAPPLAPQTSRPPAPRPAPPPYEPPPAAYEPPRRAHEPPPPAYEPPRAHEASPAPPPVAPAELPPPRVLTEVDDALRALASAVAARVTGVLRLDEPAGIRRVVLLDGDVVTAASSVEGETLLAFLAARGDLPADVATRLAPRVPPWGRLAGAALVAYGHVAQQQLWDVLQAHAAWLLTRAIGVARGQVSFEIQPPARLKGEPPVFGGTPGPALLVEIVRRAVPPSDALARLGGPEVRLARGDRRGLLDECGLDEEDEQIVRRAEGTTVGELLRARGEDAAPLLHALVVLGVLQRLAAARPAPSASPPSGGMEPERIDPVRDAELDDQAFRERIVARRALVDDADYFAILGVPRTSTGYEIRRAYVELRRALEPARVLRPSLADLADDLKLVLCVLDEAYDILKDPTRRERYRRAITAEAPQRT
jgi:hypothetical protein